MKKTRYFHPLDMILLLFLVVLTAVFIFFPLADTEIGSPIALSKSMVEGNQSSVTNSMGNSTSWLFDLLVDGVDKAFGAFGLQVLLFMLLVCLGLSLFYSYRTFEARGLGSSVLLVGLYIMTPHLSLKPTTVSYIFLALSLGWTEKLLQRDKKSFWFLILGTAIAGNFYSGAVLPVISTSLLILGKVLSDLIFIDRSVWILHFQKYWRLAVIPFAMTLALVMNPGGYNNVRYFLEHQNIGDVIQFFEFAPPTFWAHPAFFVYFCFAFLVLARFRSREFGKWFVFLAFGTLSAQMNRFTMEFFIVTSPFVMRGLRKWMQRNFDSNLLGRRKIAAIAFAIVLVGIGCLVFFDRIFIPN